MIPVSLSKLDNYPGFLLTLDQKTWWKSEPLPGDVEYLIEAVWLYGQYHIAAAKMSDGTYALFQSPDNGFSWVMAMQTVEKINCLLRIDIGIAILATSGGWWKVTSPGLNWQKISTEASNCHTVKELTGDVLIALDGTYVWRSITSALHWQKSVCYGTPTPLIAKTAFPSIDGTAQDLLVGCISTNAPYRHNYNNIYYGPFTSSTYGSPSASVVPSGATDIMIYSEDAGSSFVKLRPFRGWAYREAVVTSVVAGPIFENGWESGKYRAYTVVNSFPRKTYTDIITDIELTGVNLDGLPQFVVQVKMADGLLRHYWVRTIVEDQSQGLNAKLWVIPRFDAKSSVSNSLTSEFSRVTGSTDVQHIAIFSGTTVDDKPMLNISVDGGNIWNTYDVSNAEVYDGPDLSQLSGLGGPFLEDSYIRYSWAVAVCHNGWKKIGGYSQMNQSFDADILFRCTMKDVTISEDVLLGGANSRNLSIDLISAKKIDNTYDADVVNKIIRQGSVSMDMLNRKTVAISWLHRIGIRAKLEQEFDLEVALALRRIVASAFDNITKVELENLLWSDLMTEREVNKSTYSNMIIVDSRFAEMFVFLERAIPQFWCVPSSGREATLPYAQGVMDTTRKAED